MHREITLFYAPVDTTELEEIRGVVSDNADTRVVKTSTQQLT